MQAPSDILFRILADPTRRAIFERLARHGEQSVHALTDQSGVSQPMVSKHLAALKSAGLVRDRRDGRETHYSARPQSLGPMIDWLGHYAAQPPS
jgi:DNA-binding transcriptional ArsR family regulator